MGVPLGAAAGALAALGAAAATAFWCIQRRHGKADAAEEFCLTKVLPPKQRFGKEMSSPYQTPV